MKRDDDAQAAAMLLAILEALPPETPRDVAAARRVEGAVLALRTRAGLHGPPLPPRPRA